MSNRLLHHALKSQFKLPVLFLCILAFVIHLAGSVAGGLLEIQLHEYSSFFRRNREALSLALCTVVWVLVVLWIKYIELREIKGLGFFTGTVLKEIVIGFAAGFFSFILVVAVGYAAGVIQFKSVNMQISNIFAMMAIVPFWLIQAGSEEVLVRGWVLPSVYAKTNKLAAVIISSVLFVALHCDNAGINAIAFLNIFLVSALLSSYTLYADSIWAAVFFHGFWNFSQGSFFGLAVSGNKAMQPRLLTSAVQGNSLLSGGRFGIEASLITTVVLLLLSASLFLYCRLLKEKIKPAA